MRTYRKRYPLTQGDIAFLLNRSGNAPLSKEEGGLQKPSIDTILFYHLVFETSITKLFPKHKEKLVESLKQRLPLLIERLRSSTDLAVVGPRISFLQAIANNLELY